MKKYLIMAALAVAISGAFVSCNKDDVFSDSLIEQKAKAFEEAFVEAFGTPAPNHTWGFASNTITEGDVITRSKDDNSCGTCIKPDMPAFPNYGSQYPNYTTPAPITDKERAYVKDWFEKHPGFTTGLDIQNFYVQQVWGQANKEYTVYYDHYDQNRNPTNYQDDYTDKATMDYLCVGDGSNYSHSLDFNANNDGSGWEMVYMQNSSALSFKYKSSWSSEEFKLFKCAEIEVPGDCFTDGIARKGWYVGFCCYGEKYDNGDRKLNYYDKQKELCDDWIIKVVPGEGTPTPPGKVIEHEEIVEAGRVFCEDLGGADDLNDADYNDIVFDAIVVREWKKIIAADNSETTVYDRKYAKVCLLAAGGTIPSSVAGYQVHNELSEGKMGTNIMINTLKEEDRAVVRGAAVGEHAPVIIKETNAYGNKVDKKFYNFESPNGITINDLTINVIYNNKIKEITAKTGVVPYKICVPIGTRWAKERVNIGVAYKDFKDYCHTDPSIKFWEGTNVSTDDLWDDSSNPSPFAGYKVGDVLRHEVTENSGNNNGGNNNEGNNNEGNNNEGNNNGEGNNITYQGRTIYGEFDFVNNNDVNISYNFNNAGAGSILRIYGYYYKPNPYQNGENTWNLNVQTAHSADLPFQNNSNPHNINNDFITIGETESCIELIFTDATGSTIATKGGLQIRGTNFKMTKLTFEEY